MRRKAGEREDVERSRPASPACLVSLTDEAESFGQDILVYQYHAGERTWQMYAGHRCPFRTCKYSSLGALEHSCDRCESIKALMSLYLGLVLLYDSGYYQEVVSSQEQEERTYSVNPAGKTTNESETTRPVRVRHIRKNVLLKTVKETKPVLSPRGSWLEKYPSDEVATLWKKREPFERRTRSGKTITVTPTHKKRIRMLRRNIPARKVVELYAEPPEQAEE